MKLREIDVNDITRTVKELFIKANTVLRPDVVSAIEKLYKKEKVENAKKMLEVLLKNAKIAKKEQLPICQDTGLSVVFLKIGSEVLLTAGDINKAVNKGVEEAYRDGNLRKSIVKDPILRGNTGTNTPASLHLDIVEGDKVEISVLPKGFGCENKGRVAMLNPTAGEDAVIDFVIETVRMAGPDACPPFLLGVGIGGAMETCVLLAKKALLRTVDSHNPMEHLARMENVIKEKSNALGIGIMGLGGGATVMGVNVEVAPTHIAGLPVAVNISCHAMRSATAII